MPDNPLQRKRTHDRAIQRSVSARWKLEALLLIYLGASLLHFIHNAEYVREYPNLPAWITRTSVYATWCGITAVGALGYMLYRSRGWRLGLIVLCLYAAIGLDGLLHYSRAPMGAHSHGMNLTIWFEVLAAAVLLLYLLKKCTGKKAG